MDSDGKVEIGDIIEVDQKKREIVGISRYTSPVLNWEVWDLKPPRGKTRTQVIHIHHAYYRAEKSEDSPEELREKGLRAAQQGEAQMEIVGNEETDISDCEFTYFRAGDQMVAFVIESRQGTEALVGSRIDDEQVDLNPQ